MLQPVVAAISAHAASSSSHVNTNEQPLESGSSSTFTSSSSTNATAIAAQYASLTSLLDPDLTDSSETPSVAIMPRESLLNAARDSLETPAPRGRRNSSSGRSATTSSQPAQMRDAARSRHSIMNARREQQLKEEAERQRQREESQEAQRHRREEQARVRREEEDRKRREEQEEQAKRRREAEETKRREDRVRRETEERVRKEIEERVRREVEVAAKTAASSEMDSIREALKKLEESNKFLQERNNNLENKLDSTKNKVDSAKKRKPRNQSPESSPDLPPRNDYQRPRSREGISAADQMECYKLEMKLRALHRRQQKKRSSYSLAEEEYDEEINMINEMNCRAPR